MWACASRPTYCEAVAKATLCPAWQASDPDADPQMGLAGAGWTQEHHVFSCSDEIERA